MKMLHKKSTGRVIGAQAVGREGVDKRIDVLATAIAGKMTIDDVAEPRSGLRTTVRLGEGSGDRCRFRSAEPAERHRLNDLHGRVARASGGRMRTSSSWTSAPLTSTGAATFPDQH